MSDDERRSRDLELLKKAVDRDRKKKSPPGNKPSGRSSEIMYRGQPVAGRGGGGGRTPGAPGGGGQRGSKSKGGDAVDVKDALRKLTQLYNDGLITTAEYDAKRSEILDRL